MTTYKIMSKNKLKSVLGNKVTKHLATRFNLKGWVIDHLQSGNLLLPVEFASDEDATQFAEWAEAFLGDALDVSCAEEAQHKIEKVQGGRNFAKLMHLLSQAEAPVTKAQIEYVGKSLAQ